MDSDGEKREAKGKTRERGPPIEPKTTKKWGKEGESKNQGEFSVSAKGREKEKKRVITGGASSRKGTEIRSK